MSIFTIRFDALTFYEPLAPNKLELSKFLIQNCDPVTY